MYDSIIILRKTKTILQKKYKQNNTFFAKERSII